MIYKIKVFTILSGNVITSTTYLPRVQFVHHSHEMEDVKDWWKKDTINRKNARSSWSLHQCKHHIIAISEILTQTPAAFSFSLVFPSAICVSSNFLVISSAETFTSSFGPFGIEVWCSISKELICHILMVPSSDPEAYDSPPGANLTQWTGPWWPLLHPTIQMI